MGATSRVVRQPSGLDSLPCCLATGYNHGCTRNKLGVRSRIAALGLLCKFQTVIFICTNKKMCNYVNIVLELNCLSRDTL